MAWDVRENDEMRLCPPLTRYVPHGHGFKYWKATKKSLLGESSFVLPGFGQKCVSFWARREHIDGRSFCLRDGYFEADFEEAACSGDFGLNFFTSRLEKAFTVLVTGLRLKVPNFELFPVRDQLLPLVLGFQHISNNINVNLSDSYESFWQ